MRLSKRKPALVLVGLALTWTAAATAQFGPPRPEPILAPDEGRLAAAERVGFDQRLGVQVPMATALVDETGRAVTLGELGAGRPILLVPAYYECPMLCSMVLSGVVATLDTLELEPGRDFSVAVVSFDPEETPEMAGAAKARHLVRYRSRQRAGDAGSSGALQAAAGFHFLTGEEAPVRELLDAVGFRYAYLPESDEWAHAAGIVTLTPEGAVARYHYGVEYPPRDVRLGLIEAAGGAIGRPVDQVLLYCLRYDPGSGRYSLAILNLVRVGGIATVAAIGLFIFASWRRGRRLAAPEAG
ncbi:MAG TPA: SCO family protein [Thermoanaerobaculia bacterium]|nr:SCO family protein [Thermoanaerobaculia bacterium]